jgi:hypothetical protein
MRVSKNKAKRDFVKFEIYQYPKTKKELEHWKPLSTTTAVIDHKCKIVDAIEKALNQVKQDCENGVFKEKLLSRHFWSNPNLTVEGLALNQHVHRNTAYNWINEFINEVGANLGLFDYDR